MMCKQGLSQMENLRLLNAIKVQICRAMYVLLIEQCMQAIINANTNNSMYYINRNREIINLHIITHKLDIYILYFHNVLCQVLYRLLVGGRYEDAIIYSFKILHHYQKRMHKTFADTLYISFYIAKRRVQREVKL